MNPKLSVPISTVSAALLFAVASSAAASPCTVDAFNSCYIGVDGTDVQTLNTTAGPYDFIGLGVRSIDPQIAPNAPFSGDPSGTLTVTAGAHITLNYNPSTIGPPLVRPLDNSVLVGVSLHATGVLNVDGGSVTTPILSVGQGDSARPSTGTVTVTNGGSIIASLDSNTGPLPGFPAVAIGRGLGSVGTVSVEGAGSVLDAHLGIISMGREGNANLNVLAGGVVTAGGTVFGSAATTTGSTSIVVDGAGSKLDAGINNIVLGINLGLNAADPNHGTVTLNVRNGGEVIGNVTVGTGGTLRGNGTITGNVTNLGGTVSPGNSPGTLHIDGALHQTGGVFDIEIAGPGLFDNIDVAGDVALQDVLVRFVFIDGFAPHAGEHFDFLHAGAGLPLSNVDPSFAIVGLQPGFEFGVSSINGVLSLNARNDGVTAPAPGGLALLALGLVGLRGARRSARNAAR